MKGKGEIQRTKFVNIIHKINKKSTKPALAGFVSVWSGELWLLSMYLNVYFNTYLIIY